MARDSKAGADPDYRPHQLHQLWQGQGPDYITGLNPHLLATDPNIAADCSGWFWATRHLNELADNDDLLAITKRINGGTNGLDDRARRLKLAKCLLIP